MDSNHKGITMSTNDVPGANSSNNDTLAMGCWAEKDDDSFVFVLSTENKEVIFTIFDLSVSPPVQGNDKMPEKEFKEFFSYDGSNVKWTWHDKTPFPWDRIIQKGARDGQMPAASAHDQLSAAAQTADALGLKMIVFDPNDPQHQHLMEKKTTKNILSHIQNKINECPVGEAPSKKMSKLLKKKQKIEKAIAKEAGK